MSQYDEKLLKLQKQIAEKRRLESLLQFLHPQRAELKSKVAELEIQKLAEQADVDRLEGRSLAAFFYNVIGNMDEKLDEERRQAYEAAVKYDAAVRELDSVNYDIKKYESELLQLTGCEAEYEATLNEKAQLIKDSGISAGEDILRLEKEIARFESQIKEITETIAAGNSALATANSMLTSLDSASKWSTWDIMGGGVIADVIKHDHLDAAQSLVEKFQVQLLRFKTELADTKIVSVIDIKIDEFLTFADFFFDGIFADWAVMDRINESKKEIDSTVLKIEIALNKLTAMLETADRDQKKAKYELDAIVKGVKL